MKTSTLKKLLGTLCATLLVTPLFGLNHGSIRGNDVAFYDQGAAGANTSSPKREATLDYKIVTINGKTWAWNKINGSTVDTGADWCSQLRYWSSTNAKIENNIANRNAGDNLATEIWGTTTATIPAPLNVSFFQNLRTGGMAETPLIAYDPTLKNNSIAGDNTAPILSEISTSDLEPTSATLNFTGSDDQSDLFYYLNINGVEDVAFRNSYKLVGLEPGKTYSVAVTPIDFSGNEGVTKTISVSTGTLVQITSGIAKDIKFVLKSTPTELEYYYEFTNPNNLFEDAFLKITLAGGTEFELKPTISLDGKYAHGKTTDSRIANNVISLNCGYLIKEEGGPIWENYVMTNNEITEGSLAGTPIKHQMGAGISESEKETQIPTLTNLSLIDVTETYAILNIEGNDDSGTLYYEISGAAQPVNAFRTGQYYLTAIEAGKIYNLNVVAKDLSNNSSEAQQLTIKTANARSNINDNRGLNYNSKVALEKGGELVSILKQEGNALTIGCTTSSDVLENIAWRDRVFNTPTVIINGVSYPLEMNESKTTATLTFEDKIGEGENAILIEEGKTLAIKWSVFWGETGGGNFFTDSFTYRVGDYGQADDVAPSSPVLSISGTTLIWPASTDLLSGVKYYEVTEAASAAKESPFIIFDLGEETFSYSMTDIRNTVTVTAYDFAGNYASTTKQGQTVGIDEEAKNIITVYPNPATDVIYVSPEISKLTFYNLSGQKVLSTINTGAIDVTSLNNGLYIISLSDQNGKTQTVKLEKR